MKILWITNIPLPPICKEMNMPTPNLGGWMYASLTQLNKTSKNQYAVASVYNGTKFISKEINGIKWYLIPIGKKNPNKYNPVTEIYWKNIKADFLPDVTHIHGTEFPHGLAYVRACGSDKVVVSIQGLVSVCADYYMHGLDKSIIRNSFSVRDFIKGSSITRDQKKLAKRGKYEIELIKSVSHIIGRTQWDYDHTWAINPNRIYHFCGETLRDEFYKHEWQYSACEPHSIFLSQGSYPIKGLHQMIKALPLIIRKYPDTKLYVAGEDIVSRSRLRITTFGLYIKKLINKLKLDGKVIFTGFLNEQQICKHYLRCNVFVCPSSIENSPNSLAEAIMMNVPTIADFVGGVPEIVDFNPQILYRFDEHVMLARKVCDIFANHNICQDVNLNKANYDGKNNAETLLKIYQSIK